MKIKEYADSTIIREYERRFSNVREMVSASKDAVAHARTLLLDDKLEKDREHFGVLFLDGQHKLITGKVMFSGTINSAAVYPREIIKEILKLEAVAIILCHNHPSGAVTPSGSDRALTKKVKTACDSIDVRLLDHIIVGGAEFVSMDEMGMI